MSSVLQLLQGHSQLLLVTLCWTEILFELLSPRFELSSLQVDLSLTTTQEALYDWPHATKSLIVLWNQASLLKEAEGIQTSLRVTQLCNVTDFPFHHVHTPNKVPVNKHTRVHVHSEAPSHPPRKYTKTVSSISPWAAFKHKDLQQVSFVNCPQRAPNLYLTLTMLLKPE